MALNPECAMHVCGRACHYSMVSKMNDFTRKKALVANEYAIASGLEPKGMTLDDPEAEG